MSPHFTDQATEAWLTEAIHPHHSMFRDAEGLEAMGPGCCVMLAQFPSRHFPGKDGQSWVPGTSFLCQAPQCLPVNQGQPAKDGTGAEEERKGEAVCRGEQR